MNTLGTYRTMVLSMSSGGGMTDKQINHVVSWVKKNVSPSEYEKYADIAWQYDAHNLQQAIIDSLVGNDTPQK